MNSTRTSPQREPRSQRMPVPAQIAVFAILVATLAAPFAGTAHGQTNQEPTTESPDSPNPDPVGSEAEAVADELGVSIEEAREILLRQPRVEDLQAHLASEAVSDGLYISYEPNYHVVVIAPRGKSSATHSAIARGGFEDLSPFVNVVERAIGLSALERTQARLRSSLRQRWTTLDIDLIAGKVLVTVASQDSIPAMQESIRAMDLPIPAQHVVVSQGSFQDDASYGGLSMLSPNGNCTSGFSVSSTNGQGEGVANAAHCPNSSVTLNGIGVNHVNGSWGGDWDVQWFHTPNQADENKIRDGASSTRAITARRHRDNMAIGGVVCHYGRTTGFGCGEIASKTFNPNGFDGKSYSSTFIRVINDNTEPGDSGGPWFQAGYAYGIHKGSTSGGDPVFMAQNYMYILAVQVKIN